jgi:hypothetical protein
MTARITLHVQPRASRDEIVGFDDAGRLRVRITAPPVGGAANDAVIKLLAKSLGVGRQDVRIVQGAAARTKIVEVAGIGQPEIRSRL